jgi:thiamine biosynthesis lipoprotein
MSRAAGIRALLASTLLAAYMVLGASLHGVGPGKVAVPRPVRPAAASGEPAGAVLVSREAYLMGTRARLDVHAPDRALGLATLDAALSALEETEAELSTWRPDSAISTLNRTPPGSAWAASSRQCAMFREVYRWHGATAGAFDPAIGALTRAWDLHGRGRVPGSGELREARRASGLGALGFDPQSCTITRRGGVTLDTGAFGKGEALDRAAAVLADRSWMIDLGGQVSVNAPEASRPWRLAIAHPRERERPAVEVELRSGSLSTSGGSERDVTADGQRVGHILDPRTGRPASFAGSVTVWHEHGLAADILSTALYVMGPRTGLEWAEDRGLAALYLIPEGGGVRRAATSAFTRRFLPSRIRPR